MKKLIAIIAGAATLGFASAYAAAPGAVTQAIESCCSILAGCCSGGSCC